MYKKNYKILTCFLLGAFLFSLNVTTQIAKAEESEGLDDIMEVVEETESDEEEEVDVADFSDDELTEAVPSELPEVEEDSELTKKLHGKMLLDVDGNGEVYYVDPVTGGKEYLADGSSAHRLLERRALGITEENFAELVIGENKEDASVCEENKLGKRLRGRIVLRVEENGEAYWINPENCRAYYAGTHEAAYELMKRMSLGIKKGDLAKVGDNKRQKVKRAYRYVLYAYAEDNDLSLEEAKEALKAKVKEMVTCLREKKELDSDTTREERRDYSRTCVQDAQIPRISKERREELKDTIRETREERMIEGEDGEKRSLSKLRIKTIVGRIVERRRVRMEEQADGGAEE